jgi:hypothetical protein
MLIAEQQKNAKEYNLDQTVYMIVVLTAPHTISEKNGKPILDEVLLVNLNPQTLKGEIRDLYGHQFVCLNPNHPEPGTPEQIRDWLDLIYQSIRNPQRPVLHTRNAGIKRAAELIAFDNLSPEERALAKNKEAARVTIAKIESRRSFEIAESMLLDGQPIAQIAKYTGLTIDQIEQLQHERG